MIIRLGGAHEGIAEYLRTGIKAGREFTREQLDERVTLVGDLDVTEAIINGMPTEGNRYVHITASFKESHLERSSLKEVADDVIGFVMAGHAPDEFNVYAEAHIPRRKTITDRATGTEVERLVHIHFVIPQVNLLSGGHLNPLGYYTRSAEYLKACQEVLNAKYGLASPDDNPRETVNPESAMISRYKGDQFGGPGRELKAQIREDVLRLGIDSPEAFRAYLAERWETSTVNSRGRECFAIRPPGFSKRVRLTEAIFWPENIARPTADKIAAQNQAAAAYIEAQGPREALPQHQERVAHWYAFRAKEIKYLNSGNRREWKRYHAMDPSARAAYLAEKEAAFYRKHREQLAHDLRSLERSDPERINANLRAASRHLDAARRIDRNPELARRRVHDRRVALAARALVQRRGDDQAPARARPLERCADSVAGSYLAATANDREARAADRGEFDEIKRRLDGERLLKHLSHTHGLDPAKYLVYRTDAGDRIQCGTRSYNVTDFCTKEMHLPFAEAAPILRECYAAQQRGQRIEAKPRPREALWQDYITRWRAERWQEARQAKGEQKKRHAQERRAITERFRNERAALSANRAMSAAEKKVARSILRVRQIEAQQALRQAHAAERERLAERYPARPTFADYLQDQAQRGSVEALHELRRLLLPEVVDPAHELAIAAQQEAAPAAFEPLSYRVTRAGEVTYYDQRGDVLHEKPTRLLACRTDDETLGMALRVAERKFYVAGQTGATTLSLAGREDEVRRTIELAVKENINVQFADPNHEALRRALHGQLQEARAFMAQERARQAALERGDRKDRSTTAPERRRPEPEQAKAPKLGRGRNDPGIGR